MVHGVAGPEHGGGLRHPRLRPAVPVEAAGGALLHPGDAQLPVQLGAAGGLSAADGAGAELAVVGRAGGLGPAAPLGGWRHPAGVRPSHAVHDQPLGDLGDEAGQLVGAAGVVQRAGPGVAEEQPPLCPGDAHVGQPALLLHQVVVEHGPGQREHALLHAGQEHVVELQALCGVQRHQRHRAAGLVHGVQVGDQRHVLQEIAEPALRVQLLEFGDRALQLLYVLDAALVLLALGGLQRRDVAGALDQRLHELRQLLFVHQLRQVDHQRGEFAQQLLGTRRQGRVFIVQHRGHQRHFVLPGVLRQLVDGGVADAPLGLVDDAPGGHVVVGVHQRAHVGDQVLDLLALIEALAAVDPVGRAAPHEGLLKHAGLGVGAIEHRDAAGGLPACDQLSGHGGDEGGLVPLVHGVVQRHALAVPRLGPERLLLAAPVVGDHLVGGVQYVAGGAVVLLQLDGHALREVLLEVQYVAQVRAAPAVDGLVVVAHHAQVVPVPGQQPHQHVLGRVGVLVFVHQYVAELVPVIVQHRGMLCQQHQRLDQQIVEVQRVVAPQRLLVEPVGLVQLAAAEIALRFLQPLRGGQQPVLRVGDHRLDLLGREFLVRQVQLLRHGAYDGHAVVLVVDGELALVAQLFDVPAQYPRAAGMERGDPGVLGGLARQGVHALGHLPGRLVGEGDGQYVPRRDALLHQVSHPIGQHPGLAAARSGQNKQRAFRLLDGGALLGIQLIQVDHSSASLWRICSSTR